MKKKVFLIGMLFAGICMTGNAYAEEAEAQETDKVNEVSEAKNYNDIKDETNLTSCLNDGETCILGGDVSVTSPLTVSKTVTINGNGHRIYVAKDEKEELTSNVNKTILTALPGGDISLNDLVIEGAEKYGLQAYNGGKVSVDDVTIKDCAYGAVLVNGGQLRIKDLTMENNGDTSKEGNGIEIGQGEKVNEVPRVILNGKITITGSGQTSYLWVADNDQLKEFSLENSVDSTYKLQIRDGKVVLVNEDNDIIYTSNSIKSGVDVNGEKYQEPVTQLPHDIEIATDDVIINGETLEETDPTYKKMEDEMTKRGYADVYTDIYDAYELEIKDGEIDPEKGLTLTFKVGKVNNNRKALILHQKKNGEYDVVEGEVEDGKIEITVTELSPFMIALGDVVEEEQKEIPEKEPEKDDSPKTGDGITMALVGAVLAGANGTYAYRKLHN